MGLAELFLVAVGLSMDAFAVAVCKGLNMSKINYKRGALIALFFGVFQALMPLIGWILGVQFEEYIVSVDHWVAFVLLGFIGGKIAEDVRNVGVKKTAEKSANVVKSGKGDVGITKQVAQGKVEPRKRGLTNTVHGFYFSESF